MFPEKFLERIKTQEYIDRDALIASLSREAPVSFRTNSQKWNAIPEQCEPVAWATGGWYAQTRPPFTLDPLFHAGAYYPQEASSMFIERAVNHFAGNRTNLRVLDLCAAPGGKSTHLANIIGGRGVLVSNEVISTRSAVLCEVLEKWSARNVIATGNDPSVFSKMQGYFDIILVDAPCSGEGMFHDVRVRSRWSDINAKLCADRQKRIVADVWPSLKQGGMLIYSTCTFNPQENEHNIAWMLRTFGAELSLFPVEGVEGIVPVELDGLKGYGFYPYRVRGEGLFMSAVIKTEYEHLPDSRRADIQKITVASHEARAVEEMLDVNSGRLLKIQRRIWELPFDIDDFRYLCRYLYIIKPGTHVAMYKSTKLLPAHEAALASVYRKDMFPEVEVDYPDAMRYLKRHRMNAATPPHGLFTVKYRGVNLGWANSVAGRVNNLYPVLWRILMDVPTEEPAELLKWQ